MVERLCRMEPRPTHWQSKNRFSLTLDSYPDRPFEGKSIGPRAVHNLIMEARDGACHWGYMEERSSESYVFLSLHRGPV